METIIGAILAGIATYYVSRRLSVLFMTGKNTKEKMSLQIFIEPKGEYLMKEDKWKEDFLQKVKDDFYINPSTIYESDQFRLIGLPFFNKKDEYLLKYKESFESALGIKGNNEKKATY